MALNATKLAVQPEVLSKALCRLLAHITKKHRRENNVSVATTLGNSNQRRSIIRPDPMRDYSLTRATNHGLLLNAAHAPPVVPTPALHTASHQ